MSETYVYKIPQVDIFSKWHVFLDDTESDTELLLWFFLSDCPSFDEKSMFNDSGDESDSCGTDWIGPTTTRQESSSHSDCDSMSV